MFPLILAHNDAQENNILIKFDDNRKLLLIDYEYAGWNPFAMDLANYVNETMLDNSYPGKNGIAWYLENCMQGEEVETMATHYLKRFFEKYMDPSLKSKYTSCDAFVDAECPRLLKQIWKCALLNNFFWGIWALALLTPDIYAKEGIFNYDFALARVEMYYKIKEIMAAQ